MGYSIRYPGVNMKSLKDLTEYEYAKFLHTGELFDLYPEATGEYDLDTEEPPNAT